MQAVGGKHADTRIMVRMSLWVRESEQDILNQNVESVQEQWRIK